MSSLPGKALEIDGAVLIAAFEGWNDAGNAASETVSHLIKEWAGSVIHRVDPEDYYDFQVNRPVVSLTASGERSLAWPETTLQYAESPTKHLKVILVRGIEPSMRWRSYCNEILRIARSHGVTTVITLGALLADVPHTRPVPVNVNSDDVDVRTALSLQPSNYEGPTGIIGVLSDEAKSAGMQSLSMWAAVPHYVSQQPCPKATAALLENLESVLDETITLRSLHDEIAAWQKRIDELAEQDTEIQEYVRQLEQAKDTTDLPQASGDAIAQEFEQYLRQHNDPGES